MSKYGVWAVRSGGSVFGHAEAWNKDLDGEPMMLDSRETAEQLAKQYNDNTRSANVRYYAKEMEPQLAQDILLRREQAQEPGLEMTGP